MDREPLTRTRQRLGRTRPPRSRPHRPRCPRRREVCVRCLPSHRFLGWPPMPGPQTVIENPILNWPFGEPTRHFRFGEDGITDEVVEGRRPSSYFVPIPKAKKKGGQLAVRDGVDGRPDRGEPVHQPGPRPGQPLARWRLAGRHADHADAARVLDGPGARAAAVLLPGRGAGDGDLHHRGGAQAGRRLDREPPAGDGRRRQPGPVPHRPQDGDRHRQDRGDGDAHRLAHPQQGWPTRRTPASPTRFLVVTPGITIRDRLRVLLPQRSGQLLPPARPRAGGPAATTSAGRRSSSPTSTPSSCREKVKAPAS